MKSITIYSIILALFFAACGNNKQKENNGQSIIVAQKEEVKPDSYLEKDNKEIKEEGIRIIIAINGIDSTLAVPPDWAVDANELLFSVIAGEALVKQTNDNISSIKKVLEQEKKNGKITKDKYDEKMKKVEHAEAYINQLDARVKNGKVDLEETEYKKVLKENDPSKKGVIELVVSRKQDLPDQIQKENEPKVIGTGKKEKEEGLPDPMKK